MTRERLRRAVDNHAEEVQPMVDRLATTYPVGRLADAMLAVLDGGARFKWTSELEAALLAELGHHGVTVARPQPEHQRLKTMDERRTRRLRGLACPDCFDTGWVIADDDAPEPTAHRCRCVSP